MKINISIHHVHSVSAPSQVALKTQGCLAWKAILLMPLFSFRIFNGTITGSCMMSL